jgi:hypothetical protein
VALLLAAATLACGGTPTATFSAGDLSAVQEALALRGASVLNAVSGDAGCPATTLHTNAVRFELQLADEPPATAHLLRWRRPNQYAAAAAEFADCVADFRLRAGTQPVHVLEVPPWRVLGAGWSDDMRRTIEDALRAAGGG